MKHRNIELQHMTLACLGETLKLVTGNGRPHHIGVHMQVTLNPPGLCTAPNFLLYWLIFPLFHP